VNDTVVLGEDVKAVGIARSSDGGDGATEARADAGGRDLTGDRGFVGTAHPVDDVVAAEPEDRIGAVRADDCVGAARAGRHASASATRSSPYRPPPSGGTGAIRQS